MTISGASQQFPHRMGQSHWVELELRWNTSNATLAFVAPAKSWILRRELAVHTAWDGSSPSFDLGSDEDNGLLINDAALDVAGGFAYGTIIYVDDETAFFLYPTHGDGASEGDANILVEIIQINTY